VTALEWPIVRSYWYLYNNS